MKRVSSARAPQAKRKAKGCPLKPVRRCRQKKGKKSRRRRIILKGSRRGLAWVPVLAGDRAIIAVIMSKVVQDAVGAIGVTAVRGVTDVASGAIAAEAISVVVAQARREVHRVAFSRAVQVGVLAVIKVVVSEVIEAVVLPVDSPAVLVPVAVPAEVQPDPLAGDPAVDSSPVGASVGVALAAEWERAVVLHRAVEDHQAVRFRVEVRDNDQGLSRATGSIATGLRQT